LAKKIKPFFRFCNRLLVATAVIFGLIFIRLAYGPTPVNFMAPYISEPFEAAFPEQTLSFDGVFLTFNFEQTAFEFILENAAITGIEGDVRASFPRIAIDFDGTGLILGNLIPERIDLFGAELKFFWSAERFEAKINQLLSADDEEVEPDDPNEKPPAIRFMEALLKGEGENSRLKGLKVVNIRDATLSLEERDLGVVWVMPNSQLSLVRTPFGLSLNADIKLVSEGEEIRVNLTSGKTAEGQTRTDLEIQGLNPSKLAAEVGLAGVFDAIRMPLYGTLTTWQNESGGISRVDFDVGGGPGTIYYEPFHPTPAAFEDMVFKGTLDPAKNLVTVDLIRLSVDQAIIEGDGFLEFFPEEAIPAVRMVFRGDNLRIATLMKLWPPVPHSGGRTWLDANVVSGVLNNLQAEIAFDPEIWQTRPLPNDAMHITMDFTDGDIHFLRPMPPLLGASGFLVIEGNRLTGTILTGEVDGMHASELTFEIEDLTNPETTFGYATVRMDEDLQQTLKLIDNQPLEIFSKRGLNPEDYFGTVAGVARLVIPLYKGADPDDIGFTIEATIRNARVPGLISDGGMTEGLLDVTVTPSGLVATGTANLRGVPFDFYWTQDFLPPSPEAFSTRVELSGNLTDAHLHRFGLPDDVTMEGRARVYMSLRGIDGDLKEGRGTVDFFNAAVDAPRMDWHKEANRPAEGSFDIAWMAEEMFIRNAKITSREFTMEAAFIFNTESGLMKRADIPLFLSGRHDLTATARLRQDDVLDVTIQARVLNAIPFLETMFEETVEASFAPNMKMTLMADEAVGLNDVMFRNVSIVADKRREFWVAANLIGVDDEGGVFQIALEQVNGGRHLKAESSNAGRIALGTDLFRNTVGGAMTIEADMNVFEEPLFVQGVLSVTDLKMVKSSFLIQALADEEKSGLDDMIREEGVILNQLTIPFTLENQIFDITNAAANGPSLGFTMEGQIDQQFMRMNLNGTVVPAYTLNTIISRIPIIGTILMGGKGEGLFAVNYRISGTRDDPKVEFNPISAITPGILRKLIGNKKGTIEPEVELAAEAPPEQTPLPEGEGAEVVAATDAPIDDSEGTPTEPAPLEPSAVEAEVADDVVEASGSEEEGG